MAKKRKAREILVVEEPQKGSKANAVRAYLVAHPEAKAAEVVSALTADGVTVSPNYVSIIRGAKKHGKKRGARTPAAGSDLKDVLRREKAALLKRIAAIETLLG